MKTIAHLASLFAITALLAGCGAFSKPQASAVIACHDRESGGSIASDVLAYSKTDVFESQVAAHAGLPNDATKQIRVQAYRDTTLLEISAASPTESNALALVSASIAVAKEHFDSLAKKQQTDKIRADTSKPEEQKKIEIAIVENIPRSAIEIVELPRIVGR